MGERKVLNKYFPPDFDPSKLPRGKRVRSEEKQMKVRMMLPMSVRCNTCGNFMYKGTKFNTRMEDVAGENYLGIKIFRFYYRCTNCSAEFCMKTDPQSADYIVEGGASRNYEPWRDTEKSAVEAVAQREEEEKGNAMKVLENRTLDSKREMDILTALDEMRSLKARHEGVDTETALAALKRATEGDEPVDLDAEDEEAVRQMLLQRAQFVHRLSSGDDDDGGGGDGGGPSGATMRTQQQHQDEEEDEKIITSSSSMRGAKRSKTFTTANTSTRHGPTPVAAAAWEEEEDIGEETAAAVEEEEEKEDEGSRKKEKGARKLAVEEDAPGNNKKTSATAMPLPPPPPSIVNTKNQARNDKFEAPPPSVPSFAVRSAVVVVKKKVVAAAVVKVAPQKQQQQQMDDSPPADGGSGGGDGALLGLAGYGSSESSE